MELLCLREHPHDRIEMKPWDLSCLVWKANSWRTPNSKDKSHNSLNILKAWIPEEPIIKWWMTHIKVLAVHWSQAISKLIIITISLLLCNLELKGLLDTGQTRPTINTTRLLRLVNIQIQDYKYMRQWTWSHHPWFWMRNINQLCMWYPILQMPTIIALFIKIDKSLLNINRSILLIREHRFIFRSLVNWVTRTTDWVLFVISNWIKSMKIRSPSPIWLSHLKQFLH